jgi:hypothetical protein
LKTDKAGLKKIVEEPGVFFALELSTSSDQLYHAFHHVIDHQKTTPATHFFQNPFKNASKRGQNLATHQARFFSAKLLLAPDGFDHDGVG